MRFAPALLERLKAFFHLGGDKPAPTPTPTPTPDEPLEAKTVADLQDMAKDMGLTGYSTLAKADLITLIEENQS